MTPVQTHPNATTAATVGALVTVAIYIGSTLGWNPPVEVAAAITTLVTTIVVGLGPLVKYQKRQAAAAKK